MDGIYPALLYGGWRIVVPYLAKIFHVCLVTGYVPAIWRQFKVMLIPKPRRNSCSGSRNGRPISLTSFLLNATERLVDGFLREEILTSVPFHPSPGKSVKTAHHQLVFRVQKELDQ
jgi:hypothetical protein